jgi:hypothetical protein
LEWNSLADCLQARLQALHVRTFWPQKITPNDSSRNSCARKIGESLFLCNAQITLDSGLAFNKNGIVATHHPYSIAMSPGRLDAKRHALFIWAI